MSEEALDDAKCPHGYAITTVVIDNIPTKINLCEICTRTMYSYQLGYREGLMRNERWRHRVFIMLHSYVAVLFFIGIVALIRHATER